MNCERGLTGASAACLVGVLWSVGCGEAPPQEAPPTPVRVATVAVAAGGAGVRYSANITPREQAELSFKVGGSITEVRQVRGVDGRLRDIQDGDRVGRGTILARVRGDDYRDRLNQARANLAEAQAVLIQETEDRARARALYERESLTKPDLDAAEAQFSVAQARAEAAQAQVDMARTSLEDCALRAPFDGLILEHSAETGEQVAPGAVVFVLADTTSVKATFGVSDVMRENLREGAALPIRTEAFPEADFHGRITRIGASADPKIRVFEVELTIPNPDGRLRAGMIASLQIEDVVPGRSSPGAAGPGGTTPAAGAPVPAVPLSAIVRPPGRSDGYAVYMVEETGGRAVARLREVTLGEASGNSIAVTSGLTTGEKIVVVGATLVVDGRPVRIVP